MTGLDLAGTLGPIPPSWMGHRLDTPQERSRWPDFALFVGRTLERVLDGERVGVGEGPTDLVHVTFKETDLMGHAYGYPTPEFSRALRLVDEALGRIVEKLRAVVGADRLVVVVMADHGSLPLSLVRRAPVVKDQELEKWLLERLPVRPGHRRWLRKITGFQVFVDPDALQENRISPAEIACVLEQHPMVHSAFVGSALPKTRSDPR
ncbi:MAG: alkaline phosphatase family protein [Candidatus Riflebacteria bacterium]|nr:alkaline phosphatase family protein [Candidatus Riflebacteria bacterium]